MRVIHKFLLLLSLLSASLQVVVSQEDDNDNADATTGDDDEPSSSFHCDAICAQQVADAVTPLRADLESVRDELNFVSADRTELKTAHEHVLQQRGELQTQVIAATERSDGLAIRVNELERDLQSSRQETDAVKGQLAVIRDELDMERSKVGFLGRLQEEIKVFYDSVASFLVKLFKKKGDDEL